MCCMSKVYDSLLMWSYNDKHEGVCIGLNMEYVKKHSYWIWYDGNHTKSGS